jgi:hypothetical protein
MSTPYSQGKEVISWELVSMFYFFMVLLPLELQNNMYNLLKTKKITQMVNNDDICKGTNLTFGEDNVDVSFQYLKGRRQKIM